MIRAHVNPALLRWARERVGIAQQELTAKFKKLPEWKDGQTQPMLKQEKAFARTVHAPISYLLLSEPPEEAVPIPDFRTFAGQAVTRSGPSLLDTIYVCQERQNSYRDFARIAGNPDLGFVVNASVNMAPEIVVARMAVFAESEAEQAGYDY